MPRNKISCFPTTMPLPFQHNASLLDYICWESSNSLQWQPRSFLNGWHFCVSGFFFYNNKKKYLPHYLNVIPYCSLAPLRCLIFLWSVDDGITCVFSYFLLNKKYKLDGWMALLCSHLYSKYLAHSRLSKSMKWVSEQTQAFYILEATLSEGQNST